MTKVIYVYACFENFINKRFKDLSDEEKLVFADNHRYVDVYSLKEFEYRFNNDLICDEGYIYFIVDET